MKNRTFFHFKWLDHVKCTLDQAGFSDIWEIKNADTLWLKSIFSQRSHDIFQQKWQAEVNQNSQCTFYKTLKNTLKMEDYLCLMKLRMSPAPYVQQTKLAMNPTIFSIVFFSGTTAKNYYLRHVMSMQIPMIYLKCLRN